MKTSNGSFNNISFVQDNDNVCFYCCVTDIKQKNKFSFVYLRTKDRILKTVYREEICKTDISKLKIGSYIKALGIKKKEPRTEYGYEINLTDFEVLSSPSRLPDFYTADLSVEENIKNRAYTIRDLKVSTVFRFQNLLLKAFISFMQENGFENVNTPQLVFSSEKPSFTVDYFEENMRLPYSPHPYMTPATAAFEKTYSICNSFTSKRHTSTRHLNEFVSLNFQSGYIDSVYDIIDILTAYIKFAVTFVKNNIDEISKLSEFSIPDFSEIPIFTFFETLSILNKSDQNDLDPTDIKKLSAYVKENYNCDFVYVVDFPKEKRQFYALDNKDMKTSQSFDLYFKGQKIATGSNNITDIAEQTDKMSAFDINTNDFKTYLDALSYGIMPYGGAMIGLERFTMQFLELSNIREASLFVRDLHNFHL